MAIRKITRIFSRRVGMAEVFLSGRIRCAGVHMNITYLLERPWHRGKSGRENHAQLKEEVLASTHHRCRAMMLGVSLLLHQWQKLPSSVDIYQDAGWLPTYHTLDYTL